MQHDTNSRKRTAAAAKAASEDGTALSGLAHDFLDLWQENLLAWASDPVLSPLPTAAPAAEINKKAPGDER